MTATVPAEPTLKQLHGRAFASLYDEMDYQVARIDGTLPPELTGTLFRIGPGKVPGRYSHSYRKISGIGFFEGLLRPGIGANQD